MATTGILNATLIGIYVGTTKIANATSGTLSVTQNLATSINKDDGGWEKSAPAARSWEVSGDSELAFDAAYTIDDLFTAITSRTKLSLRFSTEVTGDQRFTGDAYITSLEVSAGTEENATYSYSFKGTGALSLAVISS